MTINVDTDQIRAFAARLADLASQVDGQPGSALDYRREYVGCTGDDGSSLGRVQSYIAQLAPQIDKNLVAIQEVVASSAAAVRKTADGYAQTDKQQASAMGAVHP
ncbi:MAG: type VII secretion target [Propionibacteriaceae bacterium]|nr:type VII secretion target [Propionibacteriaceae bacterium]